MQCLNVKFNGGKREQNGATPTKPTTHKRSKIEASKYTCFKCTQTFEKKTKRAKKHTTQIHNTIKCDFARACT